MPYGQSADIGGYFTEEFAPGAFDSDQPDNQFAYWNHDDDSPLGTTRSGTLKLYDSPQGMRFDLELPDTTKGRDSAVLVARGDVRGASISFRVPKGGDRWTDGSGDKLDHRTVTKAELCEVSLTHDPAYSGTSASLRSNTCDGDAKSLHAEHRSSRDAELAARQRREREIVILNLHTRS